MKIETVTVKVTETLGHPAGGRMLFAAGDRSKIAAAGHGPAPISHIFLLPIERHKGIIAS